jgi:mRNA interferase MazF
VSFEAFDVVTLPFPFADRRQVVVRPALVLTGHQSFGLQSGVVIVAMITSAQRSAWPFDVALTDLAAAGLKVPCVVRAKLNAVDCTLIERRIGAVGAADRAAIAAALRGLLADVLG